VFKSLIKDTLLNFVGNAVVRISFIVLSVITAQILSDTDFKNFTILISTLNMIVAAIGFALSTTIVKLVSELLCQNNYDCLKRMSIFGRSVKLSSVVIFAIAIIFVKPVSESLFSGSYYFTLFFYILTVAAILSVVASSYMIAMRDFSYLSYNRILSTVVYLMSLALLYILNNSNAFYVFLFTVLFYSLMTFHPMVRYFSRAKNIIRHLKDSGGQQRYKNPFIDITLPAFFSNLTYSLATWLQIFIVLNIYKDSQAATSIAIALMWFNALTFIPQSLSTALLPRLISASKRQINYVLLVSCGVNLTATLICILLLYIASPVINAFYDNQTSNISSLIVCMSIAALPCALCKVTGQYFIAKGEMYTSLLFNILWSSVLMLSTVILLNSENGAVSVAYGLIVSYSILLMCQIIYIWVRNGFNYFNK
jgi:O-antigen/teichoic acid export membrane protein